MLGQNFTRRIISKVRRAQHGGMLIIVRTKDAAKIVDPHRLNQAEILDQRDSGQASVLANSSSP